MCATYGKGGSPRSRSNTSSYHEFSPAVPLDLGSWSLSNVQGELLYNDNIRQLFVPEKKFKEKIRQKWCTLIVRVLDSRGITLGQVKTAVTQIEITD